MAWAALSLALQQVGDGRRAQQALETAKQWDAGDPWVVWLARHADEPSAG